MEDGYDPSYLAVERALGHRPGLTGTLEEKAEQYNGLLYALAAQWPPVDGIETHEETVNEHVKALIYSPSNIASGAKLPVCIFFHGGGWMTGKIDSEDPQCRRIVVGVPCVLVSIEYRLTTQGHAMPVPIDDSLAGFEWAYANAEKLHGDTSKYFVWGGSAGAHLALAVTNRLVGSGRRNQIMGCIAINPITCHPHGCPEIYKNDYISYDENGEGTPIVDGAAMWTALEQARSKPDDADTFIVLSPYLASFPPTWISTCGKDVLRDDGRVLVKILQDKGVEVKHVHYEGFPHFFHVIPMIPRSAEVLDDVISGINWALKESGKKV